jgi:hypothetical protein
MMQLYLQQPLSYTVIDHAELSCEAAFDTLITAYDTFAVGTDGYIRYKAVLTDEICTFSCAERAWTHPDHHVIITTIPAGTYYFKQLMIPIEKGTLLMQHLQQFAVSLSYDDSRKTDIYLRLYKEKTFETVMQLLAPIHTTAE